jgi:hypothetical protein
VSAVSLLVGATFDVGPLAVPFALGGVVAAVSLIGAVRSAGPLRALGFRRRDLLNNTWRDSDAARAPNVAFRLREEEVSQLAPPDVVMSAYGERLRLAVDDRTAIRQQLARLGAQGMSSLNDVMPTVALLLDRIAQLSAALHSLDRDMGQASDGTLDARIADARARGATEQDQMLVLLLGQRNAMSELEGRRAALRSQLERASLTLQNLRLDVLRLGALGGVHASTASRDVGHATEQARALSKDLAYLAEGAREASRL